MSPTPPQQSPPPPWSRRTTAQACICAPGYATADCSVACPHCSGHGHCHDGSRSDGKCRCDPDWYGPNCQTNCSPAACFAADVLPPPHAQCNPRTGACECQRSPFVGFWAGPHCNRCAAGYWGHACNRDCGCGGHGVCAHPGECECFADDARGYWAGTYCGYCAPGRLEPHCRLASSAISRSFEIPLGEAPAPELPGPGAAPRAFGNRHEPMEGEGGGAPDVVPLLTDEREGLLYFAKAGADGPWAVEVKDLDTGQFVARVALPGAMMAAQFRGAGIALLICVNATCGAPSQALPLPHLSLCCPPPPPRPAPHPAPLTTADGHLHSGLQGFYKFFFYSFLTFFTVFFFTFSTVFYEAWLSHGYLR